ncbi:MAG: hypothetical protein U5L05_16180 [Rubrivivax sp.]|nr:hypothetical protein [Rubrivivax sp.]
MQLRAGELGFAAAVTWPADDAAGPVAELAFQPTAAPGDELAAAISDRHTNRRMYRGPAPDAAEGARLAAAVAPIDGVQLVWLQGKARRRVLRLIWLAEWERLPAEAASGRRASPRELSGPGSTQGGDRRYRPRRWRPGAETARSGGLRRPSSSTQPGWRRHRLLAWVGRSPRWQAPALGRPSSDAPASRRGGSPG